MRLVHHRHTLDGLRSFDMQLLQRKRHFKIALSGKLSVFQSLFHVFQDMFEMNQESFI